MRNWSVKMWTPGAAPKDDGSTFGCAVHGFCTQTKWVDPGAGEAAEWEHALKGEVLFGSYEKVSGDLKGVGFKPSAAIALFVRNSGVERFLDSCRRSLSGAPVAGGVAALGSGRADGEVLPKAEDVVVLLLGEGDYEVTTMNVHDAKDVRVEIKGGGSRLIEKVRAHPGGEWEKAADYYASLRESGGVPSDDFERLTFSDTRGVNVHCSSAEGGLRTGADLPENGTLILRETDAVRATSRLRDWVGAENALVFCCAGLRKLVRAPFRAGRGSLAGFMFGEVVTVRDRPAFGNLMTTRLRIATHAPGA